MARLEDELQELIELLKRKETVRNSSASTPIRPVSSHSINGDSFSDSLDTLAKKLDNAANSTENFIKSRDNAHGHYINSLITLRGKITELENSLNLAIEIDKKLEELVPYAYNEKYGFLTSCPTNVGTGLRASVMVHLPALGKTGNIRKVLEVVNGFDMNIRGVYGEGSSAQGDLYQISNKQSLGISEEEIIKNLKIITDKVIEQERLARKILSKKGIELEDKIYRAYGILTNSRKLTSEECNILLSDIKLGTDMGIIKELDDLKVKKLLMYTKPANLQKYVGQTLDAYARDIKRAEIVKEIIKKEDI